MSHSSQKSLPKRLKYIRVGKSVESKLREEEPDERWLDPFRELVDPRREQGSYHPLLTVVGLAVLAVICGSNNCSEIRDYALEKEAWLRGVLDLRMGLPSLSTIERVVAALDPEAFEASFHQWMAEIIKPLGVKVVRIDGKTHRGSYDREKKLKALHSVSAWSDEHRLVLGEVAVDSKSNEITAIPVLLEFLSLEGAVVTMDAMGCQKDIVKQIREKKADYLLPLKANHGNLYEALNTWHQTIKTTNWQDIEYGSASSLEDSHGRHEQRQLWAIPVRELKNHPQLCQELKPWQDIQTVVVIWRRRRTFRKEMTEVHFFLTSLEADAQRLMDLIRGHWSIENQLHWSLDVVFNEDACRTRTGNGARNLGLLRRLAISLLNQETTYKASLKRKRYRALLNNDYLCSILAAALP